MTEGLQQPGVKVVTRGEIRQRWFYEKRIGILSNVMSLLAMVHAHQVQGPPDEFFA